MNVVRYLREKSNDFFAIEKYDLEDMANSHQIKFIVENSKYIKQYFKESKLDDLNNEESYYDFLYCEYVCSFEGFLDKLPIEVAEQLNDVIEYLIPIKSLVNRGHIIKCILNHYQSIFELARNMVDMGLVKATMLSIRNNYSGLKNSSLFEYLVSEQTYIVFGQFEQFQSILKKDKNRLLRLLMVDNIEKILRSDYKEICEVIKLLYYRDNKDIAYESGKIIFDYLMMRYRQQENVVALQSDFKLGYDTLYALKMDIAKDLLPIIREIKKKVQNLVEEQGRVIEHEFSNKAYVEWMEENKNASPIARYMTTTHEMYEDEYWVSSLDRYSREFNIQPRNAMDSIFSSDKTNDYFTHTRQSKFDVLINVIASKLTYWLGNEQNLGVFNDCLKVVINSIFEELNYDISYEGLDENIDDLCILLGQVVQEKEQGIKVYNKLMYVISLLEKVLRLINISLDDSLFFERNITLSGLFGVGKEYNQETLKVLGEDHLRWTRYYLFRDDNKIGFEYRNRMAHLRDINPNTMSNGEFMKIVWLILSTINTIFTNIINTDCLESN